MKTFFQYIMVLIFSIFFLIARPAWALDMYELNKIIEQKGKRWVAGETSKSIIPKVDKRCLCGLKRRTCRGRYRESKVTEKSPVDADLMKAKGYSRPGALSSPDRSAADGTVSNTDLEQLPSYFNWRDRDGYEWLTSIQDQGGCGSCWAFASISVMEAMQRIGFEDALLPVDYSEQFMVSCSEGTCSEGWYLDNTADFLRTTGVPREECFTYQARDLACENRCPEWESQIVKIPDWNWVGGFPQNNSLSMIKRKLMRGPLLGAMDIYEDFMHYSHGVYEHVEGEMLGAHAIVIVGWDDKNNCWICKNSWGEDWGESGWFQIKMGKNECGIEDELIYYSTPLSWNCDQEENFENTSVLPPGWETRTLNPNYSWEISQYPVYEGGQTVTVEYDPDLHEQDEILMSRKMRGSGLTVSFAFMGSYYWGVNKNHYQVSLWVVRGEWDGGTDDDILISGNILSDHLQHDDESWIWFPVRYHLPQEIDDLDIRLAFRYRGVDGAQFSLDKVCIQGVQSTATDCQCSRDDSGVLDISQGSGNLAIRIQNAPGAIHSFGCDVIYEAGQALYEGFEPGEAFRDFDFCGCNEISAGRIHCSGYHSEGKSIPSGFTGTMLSVHFSSDDLDSGGSGVCLENLTDDIALWEVTDGCLFPPLCPPDVNGDGRITPRDALCIYESYLEVCPTSCGSCQGICCDVDMDGEDTPSDALLVFRKYLKSNANGDLTD
ncbi:MAG: C1 family peptidase [bacterium]